MFIFLFVSLLCIGSVPILLLCGTFSYRIVVNQTLALWNRFVNLIIAFCPLYLMHPVDKFLKFTRISNNNNNQYSIHQLAEYYDTDYSNKLYIKQLHNALKQKYIITLQNIRYHSYIHDEDTNTWSISPFYVSLPIDLCHVIMDYFDIGQLMAIHCHRILNQQISYKPIIPIILGWIEFIGFCYLIIFDFVEYAQIGSCYCNIYQMIPQINNNTIKWYCWSKILLQYILLITVCIHLSLIFIQLIISLNTSQHLNAIRNKFFKRYMPQLISSDIWEGSIAIQRYCNVRSLIQIFDSLSKFTKKIHNFLEILKCILYFVCKTNRFHIFGIIIACIIKYGFFLGLITAYCINVWRLEWGMIIYFGFVVVQIFFRKSVSKLVGEYCFNDWYQKYDLKIWRFTTIFFLPYVYGCDCFVPFFIFYIMAFSLFFTNNLIIWICVNIDEIVFNGKYFMIQIFAWLIIGILMDVICHYNEIHFYRLKLKYIEYLHRNLKSTRKRNIILCMIDKYILTIHVMFIVIVPKIILLTMILIVFSWKYRNKIFIRYCNIIDPAKKPNDIPYFYIYDDKYCHEPIINKCNLKTLQLCNVRYLAPRFEELRNICDHYEENDNNNVNRNALMGNNPFRLLHERRRVRNSNSYSFSKEASATYKWKRQKSNVSKHNTMRQRRQNCRSINKSGFKRSR